MAAFGVKKSPARCRAFVGGRLIALSLLLRGGAGSARHGGLRGFIGDTLGICHCNSFLKYQKSIFQVLRVGGAGFSNNKSEQQS
jgi:hypothetical protein